jgi:hypothetical protein
MSGRSDVGNYSSAGDDHAIFLPLIGERRRARGRHEKYTAVTHCDGFAGRVACE